MNLWALRLAVVLVAFAAGMLTQHRLSMEDASVTLERLQPKPAERQSDNSLIAERLPPVREIKPPHVVPKGATVNRNIALRVKPDARPQATCASGEIVTAECPEMSVDASVVDVGGHDLRVIASSPDGTVLAAREYSQWVPLAVVPKNKVGALSLQDERGDWLYGVQVGRRFGPFDVAYGQVERYRLFSIDYRF